MEILLDGTRMRVFYQHLLIFLQKLHQKLFFSRESREEIVLCGWNGKKNWPRERGGEETNCVNNNGILLSSSEPHNHNQRAVKVAGMGESVRTCSSQPPTKLCNLQITPSRSKTGTQKLHTVVLDGEVEDFRRRRPNAIWRKKMLGTQNFPWGYPPTEPGRFYHSIIAKKRKNKEAAAIDNRK